MMSDQNCQHEDVTDIKANQMVEKVKEQFEKLTLSAPPQRSLSETDCNNIANAAIMRETQSFTGALEELKLETNSAKRHVVFSNQCPCGCLERSNSNGYIFRTRDKNTMQLFVMGSNILNYQGHTYSANDIAPLWTKDCRMWLWKSVCNARKKRKQMPVTN